MDYLQLNENICRVCLENNIILNWNDEISPSYGMSYKDCYYRYTQLRESDPNSYPTNLCKKCSNGLKSAHMLFEKARESFNILQIVLADINYILPDENILKIEDDIFLSPLCANVRIMETKQVNSANKSDKTSIGRDINVDPAHFVDITNFETFTEVSLQPQLVEIGINENINDKSINRRNVCETLVASSLQRRVISQRTGKRRNKCKAGTKTSCEKLSLCSDYQFPHLAASEKVNKRNTSLSDRLLLDNVESAEVNPSVSKSTKHKKKREKLCQYCSLKVDETHIKQHEATHNENRERKEVCPQCGLRLYCKDSLLGHMKIHLENRQKNQKCEFCEKSFFNKGALNVHRRIHLGQMVACPICSKEYYRQIDLDKHLLIHSATPLQKSVEKAKYGIQCQYCNKTVLSNNWKVHKAAHLNQPQTKCKICNKDFFSRSSCRRHIQKVHRKREFNQFIYYHVDPNTRMSHLMMKQQEKLQPVVK